MHEEHFTEWRISCKVCDDIPTSGMDNFHRHWKQHATVTKTVNAVEPLYEPLSYQEDFILALNWQILAIFSENTTIFHHLVPRRPPPSLGRK